MMLIHHVQKYLTLQTLSFRFIKVNRFLSPQTALTKNLKTPQISDILKIDILLIPLILIIIIITRGGVHHRVKKRNIKRREG